MDAGTQHTAVMRGLQPSQRYYYSYGSAKDGWSPVSEFVSAPPVGPATTVRIIAMADLGQVGGLLDSCTERWQREVSRRGHGGWLCQVVNPDRQVRWSNLTLGFSGPSPA